MLDSLEHTLSLIPLGHCGTTIYVVNCNHILGNIILSIGRFNLFTNMKLNVTINALPTNKTNFFTGKSVCYN